MTLASRWPWCDLGELGGLGVTLDISGQSNRRHGLSHSAAPQHLADRSLIRILGNLYGTISGNLFVSRLAVPAVKEGQSRAVWADHSRGRLQDPAQWCVFPVPARAS